jgi:anhydro-N-acetylmuramic acid kinase
MGELVRAVGLMSGTSLDGIDVALLETDGEDSVRRGPASTFPYDPEVRAAVGEAIASARSMIRREERPGSMGAVERLLTERNAEAVLAFLEQAGLTVEQVDVIGFHGQTVLHRPEIGLSVQLGDGVLLARLLGVPVVYDMRAADLENGGQGAPLVPVYHRALAASLPERPLGILNIGGVANITWIGRQGQLIAFDTGPGGALIDDWVARCSGQTKGFDENGSLAAKGQVNEEVVGFFAGHEYFAEPPPKSLDRNTFFWDLVEWMTPEDGAATLTAMTAEGVVRALDHLPEPPAEIVACGGGRKNVTLIGMIAARTGIEVVLAEDVGFDGDSIEAEAWAYLAVRSRRGLPITFPGTTGATKPLCGGVLAVPAAA